MLFSQRRGSSPQQLPWTALLLSSSWESVYTKVTLLILICKHPSVSEETCTEKVNNGIHGGTAAFPGNWRRTELEQYIWSEGETNEVQENYRKRLDLGLNE